MKMKLTKMEATVLRACQESSRGNGHDFGCVEDVTATLKQYKPQAIGGVITNLQKKGVLTVYEPMTTNAGTRDAATWTQFVLVAEYQEPATVCTEDLDDLDNQQVVKP